MLNSVHTAGGGAEHGPAGRGAVVGGHLTLVVDHDSPETKAHIFAEFLDIPKDYRVWDTSG